MLPSATVPHPPAQGSVWAPDFIETFRRAYRWMFLARSAEEKIASLYRAGKITGGVFLGKGQEAVSVATGIALRDGDVFAPLIRDQAGRLAFGESLLDFTLTYMGARSGPMRGRDGNVHRGRPREGLLPMISHLGAMVSVVSGILLAHRFQGRRGTVGAASLGEGATSTGSFHEALNQAAVEKLPLVLVVTNNQYAYSTPNSRQFACPDLLDKAVGYGVQGHAVDGTDLAQCLSVIGSAVELARAGGGPQLVVATTLRLVGHGEHDDSHYVSPHLRDMPLGRDCLAVAESRILAEGWADVSTLDAWHRDAIHQVEEAVAFSTREAAPDPAEEEWIALASRNLVEGLL
ncbi:MAG: Acetoin:2,6-dichlorophenolindophenol oxidoreductase subunit alpha [Verrucomicrobiota bacterium]|jgi:pyruvate dehydrogenase E1 component alpha subunit/2-oxoisovalerate dehydrogenase E1 component alpha subunit